MPQHPLQVPEVISQVVRYLDRRDHVKCLCVSKAFYASTIPWLWSSIHFTSWSRTGIPFKYPHGLLLHRYKHHIQALVFENLYPLSYLTLQGCSALRILKINASGLEYDFSPDIADSSQDKILHAFAGLIRTHSSTLREVTVQLLQQHMNIPPKDIWNSLLECSRLDILDLSYIKVPDDHVPLFLRVAAKPRSLTLVCVNMDHWPTDMMDFVLTGPRRFSIGKHAPSCRVEGMPFHIQATLARQCHNLESLQWQGYSSYNPEVISGTSIFFNTLSVDPWSLSNLHTLDLSYMKATDKELATLLCKINQLKHLNVQGTLFGPLSFQAIVMDRIDLPGAEGTSTRSGRSPPYERRLCDLVEVLDLKLCGAVTGDMIQTILASCPSLTHFHADKITITEITQGGDWVCFGLRELDIYLEADVQVSHYHDEDAFASGSFAELHRDVFGRLATLTRLERLILTDDIDSYRGKRTLDLRLDGGMDLLAGLKNMRELHFRCDGHQSMGVAEARWIAQHWPGLRVLGGLVTQNKIILEEMRSILARQKIHLQSINSNVID